MTRSLTNHTGSAFDRLLPAFSRSWFQLTLPFASRMLHFYDSSIYSFEEQKERLRAAELLSSHSIPTIVWAEDGLAFAHTVPTGLFALQLLIPDHLLSDASRIVQNGLPYHVLSEPLPRTREYPRVDKDEPPCYPESITLELPLSAWRIAPAKRSQRISYSIQHPPSNST